MRHRTLFSPSILTRLALLGSIVATGLVLYKYGGLDYWPQLVAGFAASLFAFMLALAWERDREEKRATAEATRLAAERKTAAAQLRACALSGRGLSRARARDAGLPEYSTPRSRLLH